MTLSMFWNSRELNLITPSLVSMSREILRASAELLWITRSSRLKYFSLRMTLARSVILSKFLSEI